MRRLRNTLYVTTEGAWLHKDGENLVMEVEGEVRARLPVHMLEHVVCMGRMMMSPALMGHCAAKRDLRELSFSQRAFFGASRGASER